MKMRKRRMALCVTVAAMLAMAFSPSPASANGPIFIPGGEGIEAYIITDPETGEELTCVVIDRGEGPRVAVVHCVDGTRSSVSIWMRAEFINGKWVVTESTAVGATPARRAQRAAKGKRAVEQAGKGMLGDPGGANPPPPGWGPAASARAKGTAPYLTASNPTWSTSQTPPAPYARPFTAIESFDGGTIRAKGGSTGGITPRNHAETAVLKQPTGTSNKVMEAGLVVNVPRTNINGRRIRISAGDGSHVDMFISTTTPFPIYYHYPNAYDPALDTYGRGPVQQHAVLKIEDLDDRSVSYAFYYYDAQPINSPWPVAGASTPVSQVQPDYNDYGTRGECDPDWNPCWSPSPTAVFFNIAAKIDHPAMPTCLEAQDAVVQAWGVSNATNVPYGACKRVDWQRWKITTLDCVYYVEKKPVYVNGVIEYRIVGQRYSKWSDPQPGI